MSRARCVTRAGESKLAFIPSRQSDESLFLDLDLDHVRSRIANWIDDYNQRCPHSALGYLTPAAYAANLSTMWDRLRNRGRSADRTLLHPRPTA